MTTTRLTDAELQAIEVCNGDSTLQRLIAEVRALRAERDEEASRLKSTTDWGNELEDECDRLAADVARLREALRDLADAPPPVIGSSGWDIAHRAARAALASPSPDWLEAKLDDAETKGRLDGIDSCVRHVRGENCFQPMLEEALAEHDAAVRRAALREALNAVNEGGPYTDGHVYAEIRNVLERLATTERTT